MYILIQDTSDDMYRWAEVIEGKCTEVSYWAETLSECIEVNPRKITPTRVLESMLYRLHEGSYLKVLEGSYLKVLEADTLEELKILILLEQ